jgi:hypothetical protein
MSLANEQWIKNLSELCLDPNGNYHKFRKPQGAGCFGSLTPTGLSGSYRQRSSCFLPIGSNDQS